MNLDLSEKNYKTFKESLKSSRFESVQNGITAIHLHEGNNSIYLTQIINTISDGGEQRNKTIKSMNAITKTLPGIASSKWEACDVGLKISLHHNAIIKNVAHDLIIKMKENGLINQSNAQQAFYDLQITTPTISKKANIKIINSQRNNEQTIKFNYL